MSVVGVSVDRPVLVEVGSQNFNSIKQVFERVGSQPRPRTVSRVAFPTHSQMQHTLFFNGHFIERAAVGNDDDARSESGFFDQEANAVRTADFFVRRQNQTERDTRMPRVQCAEQVKHHRVGALHIPGAGTVDSTVSDD